MKKHLGLICAIFSALIFGFTPILGRMSYDGGSNGITLTFLRAAFAMPVLLVVIRLQGHSLALTRTQVKELFTVGIIGPSATTLLLYGSYSFIPVGIATTLHFIYPVTVAAAEVLFFRSKISLPKAAALALGLAGVMTFIDGSSRASVIGVVMALASSITYTIYMLGVEKTSLREVPQFKLSFYFCAVSLCVSGIFGTATGQLSLALTPTAWFYSFLVAMFVGVGAITLFQMAIKLVGSSTTAILSTMEPITSVILGVLLLDESMTWVKIIGCVMIFAGVIIVTVNQTRRQQ